MKDRFVSAVALIALIVCAACGLCLLSESSTAQQPAPAPLQRYSMSTVPLKDGFYTVVCDTATGKCWARYGLEERGQWFAIGGPEK